ncbi:hypothetical protein L6Q96_19155 [Candidatus Binatia bacterium]|nr:hypothetical protein [Candidatus Binatia bacterium]
MTWIKVSYWIGAVADAVCGVGMVYPPIMAAFLGIDPAPSSVEARAALGMGAALMFGWTALLVWSSLQPIARRGVLFLTVCPVIVGLAVTNLYTWLAGYTTTAGSVSVWIFQSFLCVTFLSAYLRAGRLERADPRARGGH